MTVVRSHTALSRRLAQNVGRAIEASGPVPYILRVLVPPVYGIRVAFGHKSRTFGYPDPTLHVPTNPTAWTVSTTSRGQFRSTEVAERSPGTPQARWRWTTPVRPREASIVQHKLPPRRPNKCCRLAFIVEPTTEGPASSSCLHSLSTVGTHHGTWTGAVSA